MDGHLLVLALAALPAAGNFLGGAAAEILPVSERGLSIALHAAVGVVLAVVGLELMPEALAGNSPWVPILPFIGGGAFFLGLDKVIGIVKARVSSGGDKGPSAVFSGVSLDLFSDGVMIGTVLSHAKRLGLQPVLSYRFSLARHLATSPCGTAQPQRARSHRVP